MTILLGLRQQRFQAFPEFIGQDLVGHEKDLRLRSSSETSCCRAKRTKSGLILQQALSSASVGSRPFGSVPASGVWIDRKLIRCARAPSSQSAGWFVSNSQSSSQSRNVWSSLPERAKRPS